MDQGPGARVCREARNLKHSGELSQLQVSTMRSYFVKMQGSPRKHVAQWVLIVDIPLQAASAVEGAAGAKATGCPRAALEPVLSRGQGCLEAREVGCEVSALQADTLLPKREPSHRRGEARNWTADSVELHA